MGWEGRSVSLAPSLLRARALALSLCMYACVRACARAFLCLGVASFSIRTHLSVSRRLTGGERSALRGAGGEAGAAEAGCGGAVARHL